MPLGANNTLGLAGRGASSGPPLTTGFSRSQFYQSARPLGPVPQDHGSLRPERRAAGAGGGRCHAGCALYSVEGPGEGLGCGNPGRGLHSLRGGQKATQEGKPMPEYRRKKGSDAWHWCTNCSNWPKGTAGVDYDSQYTKPSAGELDNECKSKEAAKTCTSS